jgi:hypothetical protein
MYDRLSEKERTTTQSLRQASVTQKELRYSEYVSHKARWTGKNGERFEERLHFNSDCPVPEDQKGFHIWNDSRASKVPDSCLSMTVDHRES